MSKITLPIARVIIINHNNIGGSYKWIEDLQNQYEFTINKVNSLESLNNTFSSYSVTRNTILIIQSFLYTDITINHIKDLYQLYLFKIIIPIHDWYWFVYPLCKGFSSEIHNKYLSIDNSFIIDDKVLDLFKVCYKIICPSKFVFDIIKPFYSNSNLYISQWIDYDLNNMKDYSILKNAISNYTINIACLTDPSECKGQEQVEYLQKNVSSCINFMIINETIPRYQDDLLAFNLYIEKYNIHGLLHLNKWGETYGYALTKSLLSGLPILYNNIGSFKERIPKNEEKYVINGETETDYSNMELLTKHFMTFIDYIITNNGSNYNSYNIFNTRLTRSNILELFTPKEDII
jgi:hypothetical protein